MGLPMDGESIYRLFWFSFFIIFYTFNIYNFYKQKVQTMKFVLLLVILRCTIYMSMIPPIFFQTGIPAQYISIPHSMTEPSKYFILVLGSLWQAIGRITTKSFALPCNA